MSNLVIVAIPAEDDYIHKISSEKVPHMTMLFLGEVEGKPVAKIADFLQHAVSILELGPFGLEVDHRGTLGADEADVIFFRKDPWSFKRIAEFRGQLLKESNIKSAFDSADQFPEWNPHLTLGYPPTPAREDKRDYPGIRWVEFDRIALWFGDYEGLEFQLKYKHDYDLAEVAMSSKADAGEKAVLEHFGTKGMRWGIHKQKTEVTTSEKTTARGKTKVKAEGGHAHPAAPEALKAAEHKQKLKKSGAAALSNKELRDLATRLQLEQQVSQLSGIHGGEKFVKDQLKTSGKRQVGRVIDAKATQAVDATVLRRKQP